MENEFSIENLYPTANEFWHLLPTSKKIQKIPMLLRQEECNKDAYDPKVVSFGPYHHGKSELKVCEDAKKYSLQLFVEGSGHTPEFFCSKVLENIADIRSRYIEDVPFIYSDEEFAEMMLLDACFLIFYLETGTHNELQRFHNYTNNHLGRLVVSLVHHDIFLLENQIPFQVLKLLISLRYNESEESVIRFLHQSIWGQYKQQQIQDIQRQQQPPLHLFEAFRRVLVWDPTPKNQVYIQVDEDLDVKKHHKTFRSARDLKAKGIHFKPSSSKSLKGIEFNHGLLQLPTWFVSSLSRVFFLNMIAYELCPNNVVDSTVISYINFMKSLIESPGDVKELREKRILLTTLGSDEEVVRLYRGMNTYGMSSTYSFIGVKQRIQQHYDSKAKTWMAELKHTYLSSPWSFIGWFAGVFLLVLTFTQTYYTVNPSH